MSIEDLLARYGLKSDELGKPEDEGEEKEREEEKPETTTSSGDESDASSESSETVGSDSSSSESEEEEGKGQDGPGLEELISEDEAPKEEKEQPPSSPVSHCCYIRFLIDEMFGD